MNIYGIHGLTWVVVLILDAHVTHKKSQLQNKLKSKQNKTITDRLRDRQTSIQTD